MPPLDYVQAVRSVYGDRRAMLFGAGATALAAGAAAAKTNSLVLYLFVAAFIVVGAIRYAVTAAFEQAEIGPEDAAAASIWETRATLMGTAAALVYGLWCFAALTFTNDAFAQLASVSLTVAALVGICARNFALIRLVALQALFIGVPLGIGLVTRGDVYHAILAVLLVIQLITFRDLAGGIRAILMAAVHGRVEANRLALELDTALDTMNHGLCMLDAGGLITVANDRAIQVFAELVPGSWEGRPFAALISAAAARGAIPQRAADQLLEMINLRGSGKIVLRLANSQFTEVTVSSRQARTVALFEDITARVKAEERINFMAHYDALTGLPNRAYFAEQVDGDLDKRRINKADHLSLLLIVDLDDFKHVNDTMGHLVGDRLLVEASERLSRVLSHSSILARFGGDEFVVYRSGDVVEESAVQAADAILAAFKPPFEIMGESFAVNVSVGAVLSTDPADTLDALMTKADLALYKAKAAGKAQMQVFHDEMDTDYRYRQRLKNELRTALAENGLSLVFQPLVDIRARRVVACEALARWNHPELGFIPPSLFIPIAEESGLITEISRWVLATATRECCNWPSDVSVSVNVSARDFRAGDMISMVEEALASSGLAPERLEIEVTETALIEEKEAATQILGELAAKGIGIALDDFGTGYSSLSYLKALPFTKLKIDRSFVMDIATNNRSLTLLANVAQLGKDINLLVTAEGVETEDQLELIVEHTRVDLIQGYLFGVPLPRREVGELIGRMASTGLMPIAKRKQG